MTFTSINWVVFVLWSLLGQALADSQLVQDQLADSSMVLSLADSSIASSLTHQPGYCAMYDNCGKKSFFGTELPCPNNTRAIVPDQESVDLLSSICGADFDTSLVCCSQSQILNLQSNLKKVDPLISSCPACRKNFYDFFCEFTCSSNQSMFVDITKTAAAMDTKKTIVTELSQFIEPSTAQKFFDSCKNLKFSATNGYAMDLIGGGAKNFQQFLKFLGDEKPLLGGSPFQMNFQYNTSSQQDNDGLTLRHTDMKDCNDEVYKCACSDCLEACPKLPHFKSLESSCTVGGLPCFTFAVIIVFGSFIVVLGAFHVYIAKTKRTRALMNYNGLEDIINPSEYISTKKLQGIQYLIDLNQKLVSQIETFFEALGEFAAKFPGFTIGSSLFVSVLLSFGMIYLEFETNPINLWVSPNEPHLKNYQYFEENFGEWFRIEQIIISNKDESPILDWKTVEWWFENELSLQEFHDEENNETLALDDFCFKPMGDSCVIESFTQYFGGNIDYLSENTWEKKLLDCTNSPVNCLPSFQQPLKKNLLFNQDDVIDAKAFMVTILLDSKLTDHEYTSRAERYETKLKQWLLNLQHENPKLDISFSTEMSLTEELNKSTNTDVNIIVISYLVMFLYASVALGGKLPKSLQLKSLIYTRFQLGCSGIIIILLSVLSSLGLFSLIGLKSTLIIAEVIPFLVLAIGIDNIFLMVHELHLVNEDEAQKKKFLEKRIGVTLKNIGPSCLISAILQISMFLLATNVEMPAVKNFAFYSAGAILINFLLQMTCFVSILTLDQKRLEDGRLDCFPWIQPSVELPEDGEETSAGAGTTTNESDHIEYNYSGLIKKYYAPKILTKTAKPKILTAFILWIGISLSLLPYIELGLDQKIALPTESYLINYFESMAKYINVGPPMFLVVKNLDLTSRENQQKVCGKFSTCEEFSLSNILEQEYKRSDVSTITDPLSNWLDDFLTWLNPNLDQCCRLKKNSQEFCSPRAPDRQCEVCYLNHEPQYNISMEGLPEGEEFMYFFQEWIEQPSDPCPLGGKAPYGNAIAFSNKLIETSYFRTSHSPLRTQHDFIHGFRNSLRIVEEVNSYQKEDMELFAFSPFYIFFVQYETIVRLTFTLLAIAMVIIALISLVLLGSLKASLVLVMTIILILVNIGGVLSVWNVSLNAVSLVNLIICVGLAVEFCIHITRGYLKAEDVIEDQVTSKLPRDKPTAKAFNSLVNIGGSVLGGITLTKLIGIMVLAFTRSQIFEVYYFRMWILLIFIAAVHSLCFLPVMLTYFG